MRATLNDPQKRVLVWLRYPTSPAPFAAWKTTAKALENRGLVHIRRGRGGYRVELTALGDRLAQQLQSDSEPQTAPPQLDTSPLHPAVAALLANPIALPTDAAARRRAVLATHLLATMLEESGFGFEVHPQPGSRTCGGHAGYSGERLLTVDARGLDVVIRIGQVILRAQPDHAEAPAWTPADRCFFRVVTPWSSYRFAETEKRRLTEVVPSVLKHVEHQTEASYRRASRSSAPLRIRQAEKRRQRHLREHYRDWEEALHQQASDWRAASELRAYVVALFSNPSPEAALFAAWSSAHIDALDPAVTFPGLPGRVPTLSHADRRALGPLPS